MENPERARPKPPADINDFNAYSDYYREVWGLDNLAISTVDKNLDYKDKRVTWFPDWLEYKKNLMPIEKIEQFKTDPNFSYNKLQGIGLIIGQVKYGPNKGLWINFFDADNEKGKDTILEILGYPSVDELKQDCVVEYHPSAPHKFHVYLLSEVPFENFTLSSERDKIKNNQIPGIEIKGAGSGLAYPTPSLYSAKIGEEKGERYQLVDGSTPVPTRLFTESDIAACETRLDSIAKQYGNASYGKILVSELLHPDYRITEGNYRKRPIIQIGMHYLHEFKGDKDKAENKTREWNEKHCDPPLTYEAGGKFDDAWKAAIKYYKRTKEEEEDDQGDDDDNDNREENTKEKRRQKTVNLATKLIEEEDVIWFHDEYQTAYSRIKVDNHFQIFRVYKKDRHFKLFLTHLYYEKTGDIIKDEDLKEVIRRLEAKAIFDGKLIKIHLRKCWNVKSIDQDTGKEELDRNVMFYDMCSPNWTCIMVDGTNNRWDLLPFHPEHITFYRYQQVAQRVPSRDYESDIFEQWFTKMHITHQKDRLLLKIWCVAAFLPDQPHPMLVPHGPPGGAKSTFCKQLQIYIDPYAGEPLILPTEKKELAQQAHHRALLVYDNVQHNIPKWLSDLLCQLITSANVSKRILYSDDDDFAYVLMRSVVLNGLQVPALKPDALDRTIAIHFDRIKDEDRKTQAEIDDWFQKALPQLLGKTFDVLARSLKIFASMPELERKPRMADFASCGASISRAFAEFEGKDPDVLQQQFLDAYDDIMERQNIDIVEGNSVASALIRWHNEFLKTGKEGDKSKEYLQKGKVGYAPGDLLRDLTARAQQMGFDTIKDREWPKKPNHFTHELRPLAPDIRHGYRIDFHIFRDTKGEFTTKNSTWIEISEVKEDTTTTTAVAGNNNNNNGGVGRSDKSSSENEIIFGKPSPPSPPPPPTQNSLSKQEEIGGGHGGGPPYPSPPPSPPKSIQIEHEISVGGDGGGGGGHFAETILFSQEESSSLSQPSLIDDIKHNAVAIDPEWDNRPGMDDRMLQFNFYDSQGKNWVINIDRDCNGSEALLLQMAEDTIRNYKVVVTYFEKGEGMGFSKWNARCLARGRLSPIFMGNRKDQKDACISLSNYNFQPIKDIDLGQVYEMPIIENFLHNIYLSHELTEVSQALLGEGKLPGASGEHFADMPLDQQIAYGLKDAELTYRLAGYNNYAVLSMLEKVGQMFIGGSFADLAKMCNTGPTQWWATLFKNKFNAQPSPTSIRRKGVEGELKGGHVEDINEIKEYRWVVIFDFRGQYPSIISKYNICFTTACCDCCKDNPAAYVKTELPEVDNNSWWFCRKQRGILPQIVDALVAMRDDFKAKKKAADKAGNNKELAQEYDVMQNACKLLANSLYGVFGEKYFEFGDLRVANTITGYGRAKVINMGKVINEAYPYLKSVYHDTDSAFIMGLEPQNGEVVIDDEHPIVKDIIARISAPEGERGLGLPLEYKKCYRKVMIKASKNYMGIDAATGKIETVGLIGKKRSQCGLVRKAFEQQREYWKDDAPKEVIEGHIAEIIYRLDSGLVPLEDLQEKMTIQEDPWTGYKNADIPTCYFGRKYNKRQGESTPPFYLARQEKEGDLWFTEDPTYINYKNYKERLKTALIGLLAVRDYSEKQVDDLLGLITKPPKTKKEKAKKEKNLIKMITMN